MGVSNPVANIQVLDFADDYFFIKFQEQSTNGSKKS
jgi:hypothetical protein